MGTPVHELPQPPFLQSSHPVHGHSMDSEDEGTLQNEQEPDKPHSDDQSNFLGANASQSQSREQKFEDDLAMLQAERVVSHSQSYGGELHRSLSVRRSRSRPEPVDQFDVNTNPLHQKASTFRPPANPTSRVAKTFKRIHESSFLVRYFCYIVPVVAVILIPLLLGGLVFKRAVVGGVRLLWFCVWLEIVWLTLWAGRILAKALPFPVGLIASLFTNNSKKWRDMCKQLEIPATLFFWALAVLISFLPSMVHHHLEGGTKTRHWEIVLNKVIISIFVGACINFFEKIIIQLIAISFHLRTYADRIDINKFQIGSLTKLYEYSRQKIAMEDSEFEEHSPLALASGTRTPAAILEEAQKKTKNVFGKIGDVTGKVAGDFTGRTVTKSTHPRQLILLLLSSPAQSQVLARRLFRTFAQEDAETITLEDLKHAFDNDEEADSAFTMFDKDLNGDISMQELEAVCVEIGKERKAITASLKDLDSVVAKLDAVLSFFVLIAFILVLVSLLSTSAAGVLTSAGSAVLALSWLLSQTAQEFLASCIFVLVKHPFDVGDRVTVYGSTGAAMKGDDYFVKEISLLYTEFKKLEGQIVQAPNSYLNTLFILNMRRSGGLAEAVALTVKFGTTLDQIDALRAKLLEYVKVEKREYQPNILTEIREVVEAHAVNLNVIFFYKSNWQNELLRLQRRNKFICAMMLLMQEIGIEGPQRRIPGAREETPFYYAHSGGAGRDLFTTNNRPYGDQVTNEEVTVKPDDFAKGPGRLSDSGESFDRYRSILRTRATSRPHAESVSAISKRVDFSLGMKDVSSADLMDDLSERKPTQARDLRDASASRNREEKDRISGAEDNRKTSEGQDSTRLSFDRSTSRASGHRRFGIKRTETEGSHIHRNRFFSRSRPSDNRDEEEGFMQQSMADIPEISPQDQNLEKSNPLTGFIGTQAVRASANAGPSSMQSKQQMSGPVERVSSGGGGYQAPQISFDERPPSSTHSRQSPSIAQTYEMRHLT